MRAGDRKQGINKAWPYLHIFVELVEGESAKLIQIFTLHKTVHVRMHTIMTQTAGELNFKKL